MKVVTLVQLSYHMCVRVTVWQINSCVGANDHQEVEERGVFENWRVIEFHGGGPSSSVT